MTEILFQTLDSMRYGLRLIVAVASVAVIVRLWWWGLLGTRWPVAAFALAIALQGALRTVHEGYDVWFYEGGEVLKLALATFGLWTLLRQVFVAYPSLGGFVTQLIRYALPICAAVAVVNFWLDPLVPSGRSPSLHLFFNVQRALASALLAFSVSVALFVNWFPVRMRQNDSRILTGFLVLLAVDWLAQLAANAAVGLMSSGLALVQIGTSLGVALFWVFGLSRQGEQSEVVPLPPWSPGRLLVMTEQLDQLQAQLSRRGF
jgi:hypothetical protein